MAVYGWDASNFDWDRGPMNYAAAARDGIGFATHKATEGTRTVHNRYGEALRRARDAGIPALGAYHVVRTPGNAGNGTIAEQVRHFLTYLDQQTPWWRTHPAFMLQVDLEHWTYDKVAPDAGVEMCRLLRAQTGKWVVLYAPRWAYGDTIGGDTPLWASNYVNGSGHFKALYPGDQPSRWAAYSGRTPVFLQYTSSATIGGQGTCDANVYRGGLAQLIALVGGKTTTMSAAADTEAVSDEEDDMAGGIPPTEIPTTGPGSFTIWPVNTGAAGHGPAWINVGNDTNGQRYGVRVWASKGDKAWFPVGNGTDGIVLLDSGQSWGTALPDGTRILTVSRVPIAANTQAYGGHLTFAVEYGRRAA